MNIVDLPKTGTDMKALIESVKREMSDQMEIVALLAKMTRHKYECLVAEGFTSEQALELSKPMEY